MVRDCPTCLGKGILGEHGDRRPCPFCEGLGVEVADG